MFTGKLRGVEGKQFEGEGDLQDQKVGAATEQKPL